MIRVETNGKKLRTWRSVVLDVVLPSVSNLVYEAVTEDSTILFKVQRTPASSKPAFIYSESFVGVRKASYNDRNRRPRNCWVWVKPGLLSEAFASTWAGLREFGVPQKPPNPKTVLKLHIIKTRLNEYFIIWTAATSPPTAEGYGLRRSRSGAGVLLLFSSLCYSSCNKVALFIYWRFPALMPQASLILFSFFFPQGILVV